LAFTKIVPFGDPAVNKNISPGDLTFIKSAPAIITDALISAFKSAESNLTIPEELQSNDRTYLLPFIYYYNAGCFAMRKEEDKKLGELNGKGKMVQEEQGGNALLNILNFTDEKFDALHCTILNPIKVGRLLMHNQARE
jgi:hypothetical protein